jgi:hypothetical protein
LFDWWRDPETFTPDFTDVDVFVDPDGDEWRLTIVAMPMQRIITKDVFPEDWLAVSRANDFTNLMRKHWPDVRIHRYIQSRTKPLPGS